MRETDFTCPTNRRTAAGCCGVTILVPFYARVGSGEAEQAGVCQRCCFGCSHAQDLDCNIICPIVADNPDLLGGEKRG